MLLSIVIITHERHRMFENALQSALIARRNYHGDAEIIIVNSSRNTVLKRPISEVREIHVPDAPKASEKRNIGLSQARNDWVLFLDDDCQMADGSLEIIAQNISKADGRTAAFFGVTEFVGKKSYWFTVLEGTDFFTAFRWAYEKEELEWGSTSLAIFCKKVLLEVGGFSSSFSTPAGGEDIELCFRLREKGARLVGIPKVLVLHNTETWNSLYHNLRRAFRYGMGEADLQVRYPDRTRFDSNSPLLLTIPVVILLTIMRLVNRLDLADLSMFSLLAATVVCGGYLVEEKLHSNKPLLQIPVLLLHRFAYRLGILSCLITKRRFMLLFSRFSGSLDSSKLVNHSSRRFLRAGSS